MKRFNYFFAVLLVVLACVGCGGKQVNEPVEEPSPSREETILEDKTLLKNNTALYKLDNQMLDGITYSRLYPYKNHLLFAYDIYNEELQISNTYLRLIDFETGEVIAEKKMRSILDIRIQEIDGNLVVHDSAYGMAWVFDETLEILEEYEFDGDSAYFDATGENVYQFSYNEGVKIRNLESGKENTILSDSINLYAYGEADQKVSITYTDTNTRKTVSAYVDLSDASVTVLDTPKVMNTIYYGGGLWHGLVCDDQYYYLFGDEENPNVFESEAGRNIFLNSETSQLIMFGSDPAGKLQGFIYDKEGNLVSSCDMTGFREFIPVPPIWYEEYQGYLFTVMNEQDEAQLLFWDVSEKMDGAGLSFLSMEQLMEVPEGTAVPKMYYSRAKAISEKYGVQILIADQCETDFDARIAKQLLNEKDINRGLDEVELALSSYPKNFFSQLKYNSYTEIEIQLLGEMEEKADGALLAGFIEYRNGKFVMGLNITEDEAYGTPTHQTFFHEVSHIIEQKLESESEYVNNGYSYDRWNTFNPDGFVYEKDSEEGISMYWDYPDYFVDSYSASHQNEDRARILEYASAEAWGVFEGSQPLKDKLAYYSECIRKGFDTTGWPEKTVWENTPW